MHDHSNHIQHNAKNKLAACASSMLLNQETCRA